ncbi:MAG: AAA family ATPase [Planctomycetota bacterium]|nr:AAA family ATPase [Planctomycetota bacterium]MDA1105482.1 AAA family ATPase [Planctomycetota bacterium]
MSNAGTLVLVGMRGSGKSVVGAQLARELGRRCVDTDAMACAQLGVASPAEAFRTSGEAGWRLAEVTALSLALDRAAAGGTIIATGGGLPTIPRARELLAQAKTSTRVVWLAVPVEVLRDRLRRDAGDRPTILGHDLLAELPQLLQLREPFYREVADYAADASGPVDEVSSDIIRWLSSPSGLDP